MASKNVFGYGHYKRAKRRVNVLRGFDGSDPTTFTHNAPVADGVTIYSGQVVSLDSNGEWVLGATKGKVPYIALSDSVDTDVSSSGLLPALSCAGKFEIETAWYASGVYTDNTVIVAATGGDAGKIAAQATPSTSASTDILGIATRGGLKDLNGGPGPKIDSQAEDANIVTFVTNWVPART